MTKEQPSAVEALQSATLKIQLNGQLRELPRPCSVADLLLSLQTGSAPVAVERNEQVVPKARHADTLLVEGDQVEVVTLVGGG
ncbi:MAG: sulfur carrier protein ThiS [Pirellulaceae bacterium]